MNYEMFNNEAATFSSKLKPSYRNIYELCPGVQNRMRADHLVAKILTDSVSSG